MYTKILMCALGIVLVCLTGCERNGNDDPKDEDGQLRSSDSRYHYIVNNADATRRLNSIAYNHADTQKPVERFKLVHISDTHLSSWSGDNKSSHPKNLIESVEFVNQRELNINAMVETGDHISYAAEQTARAALTSFFHFFYENNDIPSFSCYGNHDSNIDKKEGYIPSSVLANVVGSYRNYAVNKESEQKSYYYADVVNPQGGYVRIIALDMLDQPGNDYNTLHYAIYSQEQINWLGNVALKEGMTARHSVVVLTHFPFQQSVWGGDTKAITNTTSYLRDGNFVNGWRLVPEIIEAWRTRTSINKTYPNKVYPERGEIKSEFDFTNAAGEFVCYLGGHAHTFALFDVQNTGAGGLPPQKMILCNNQAPSEASSYYTKVSRKENSVISNSFNIYAIDTSEKMVYITFFGAYIPEGDLSFPVIIGFSYL
jgi:predicted MPP superfamily phosphohydrolase